MENVQMNAAKFVYDGALSMPDGTVKSNAIGFFHDCTILVGHWIKGTLFVIDGGKVSSMRFSVEGDWRICESVMESFGRIVPIKI